jgi:hypothetical protein
MSGRLNRPFGFSYEILSTRFVVRYALVGLALLIFLGDNTQHSLETDMHAFGGIRNPQSQQSGGGRPTP